MGMTLHYIRISSSSLDRYLQDAVLLKQDYFTPEGIRSAENIYDIDKSWDGIIYLLTGKNSSDTSSPLSRLMFSNRLIDKQQDLGTGPAHYLLPEEVMELHEQIKDIQPLSLKATFDAAAMKELGVYPNNVWDEEEVDDYLIEYFETVQEIFAVAAKNEEAIITLLQ